MEQKRFPIFADRFAELRGEKTQGEFAEFLGISRPTVGFYENGTRIPDALVLRQIAEKCQVSADWLIGLTGDKRRNPSSMDKLGLSEKALAELEWLTTIRSGNLITDKTLATIPEIESRCRKESQSIAEIDALLPNLLEIYKVSSAEDLIPLLAQRAADEEIESLINHDKFNSSLVLDVINLFLEREAEENILRNLASYIFAGRPNTEKILMSISQGLNKDNGFSTYTELSSSQLSNIYLLDAENSIRKLKELEEKYQIWSIDAVGRELR